MPFGLSRGDCRKSSSLISNAKATQNMVLRYVRFTTLAARLLESFETSGQKLGGKENYFNIRYTFHKF